MQPPHRLHEAQPEPSAGFGAALLQAHEALQHALAVLRRDAGSIVGDGDLDRLGMIAQVDGDRRIARGAWLAEYLMAFSIRLATACTHQLAIGGELRARLDVDGEAHAALLGHRLVQLGDVAHGAADVEALGVSLERAGFQPRYEQKTVERLDQLVGLLDRVLEPSR